MPCVSAKVFYFPQGHAKHACGVVDFHSCPDWLPPYVLCKVSTIKFMANLDTDEVFVKIRLILVSGNDQEFDDNGIGGMNVSEP